VIANVVHLSPCLDSRFILYNFVNGGSVCRNFSAVVLGDSRDSRGVLFAAYGSFIEAMDGART
jgi:hypothetical protein